MPKPLVVDRVIQANNEFCGPAVATMLKGFEAQQTGAGRPANWQHDWQQAFWPDIQRETLGPPVPAHPQCEVGQLTWPTQTFGACTNGAQCVRWVTTPHALAAALSRQMGRPFAVVRSPQFEFVMSVIVRSLEANRPVAALIDEHHWVIVRGYRARGGDPLPIAGRDVASVQIHDPQHAHRTTFGIEEFRDDYLVAPACPVVFAHPQHGFDDTGQRIIVVEAGMASGMGRTPELRRGSEQPEMDAPAALRKAAEWQARLLGEREDEVDTQWEASLRGAVPQDAWRVRRLDRDRAYFVVNFVRHGAETARMALNARTGSLVEVEAIEVGEDHLAPWTLDRQAGADLVWRPCRESQTPLLPFFVLADGGYIRADGEVFARLTRSAG